ncbi:eukaryotic translation initiation factor 4b/4h [Holotrichia oblita]|uniref:Eukaryotic translation initiation factor 4b/4h n=1 Tax=Holotrichia oblita TaxID=644536 RepID=A0ACB9TJF6_HOLOL|nr:eukaryotic translation initiation factor 4b/4h [Holotrichia oblita]
MDYSIGSVADLISGSTTPNKQKVVKKQFKNKPTPPIIQAEEGSTTPNKQKVVKKQFKNKPTPPIIQAEEKETDSAVVKVKKAKKRSFSAQIKQTVSDENATDQNIEKEEDVLDEIPKKKTKSPKIKPVVTTTPSTDDDESDDDVKNKKKPQDNKEEGSKDTDTTTVFVGNLPITVTHKKLVKMFSKYGTVLNARIRSIPVADPKVPKKVAAIKKQFHPDRKSVHGYVTFANVEDAQNALCLNGKEYKEHHIRVNIISEKQNPDKSRAIFLGNVSFAAEEEELWQLFQSCGEIESVRLVRDRRTDFGKGFGYVNFKSADSVELALQMGEVKLRDRVLRISLYNGKAPKKQKQQKQPNKNVKGERSEGDQEKTKFVPTARQGQFQGKFATTEKKKKFNKRNQQKKNMAKKIAPKTMSG